MSMSREYIVRVLPEPNECIQKDDKRKGFWKIKGHTFPNISLKFSMRKKSANFAKQTFMSGRTSQTYVVLYADEETVECLFVFRYYFNHCRKSNDTADDFLSICRCVGKFKARHHWEKVISLLNGNKDEILSLREMEYKKIPIF